MPFKVNTTRFGSMEVEEKHVLHFPEGILGFGKLHDYFLLEEESPSLFLWLQAIKKSTIAFPLLETQIIAQNLKLELAPQDAEILKLSDMGLAKSYAIVTIPSDPSKMTANLRAPLVVNIEERLARQVILENEDYPIRYPIYQELMTFCSYHNVNLFTAQEKPTFRPLVPEESRMSLTA